MNTYRINKHKTGKARCEPGTIYTNQTALSVNTYRINKTQEREEKHNDVNRHHINQSEPTVNNYRINKTQEGKKKKQNDVNRHHINETLTESTKHKTRENNTSQILTCFR